MTPILLPGFLPKSCRDDLARAMQITDSDKRLDAIDKARERAVYLYPHLFKETNTVQLKLSKLRLAFGQGIFEKQTFGDGEPAYQCKLLLTPLDPQRELIVRTMKDAAKIKWGEKAQLQYGLLEKTDKLCLHDGDTKPNWDGFEGNWFLSARSTDTAPTVVDRAKKIVSKDSGIVYSGCYVNAIVDIYAQDNQWGKRINCKLQGIQLHSDGDAFAGGRAADVDEFDDLGADGEKATAGVEKGGDAW